MNEPPAGYLLAGDYPEQLLYARADWEPYILHEGPERWFNVADQDDIYTFEDLVKDYKTLVWLTEADPGE